MRRVIFQWDGADDPEKSGVATYFFPGSDQAVRVTVADFKSAHELSVAIEREMSVQRQLARANLLSQIAQIQP